MSAVHKKSPGFPRGFQCLLECLLDSNDVRGLKPFRTLGYFERYTIAFSERFESVATDSGKMTEYIVAIFLLKKSKTLTVVKPLNCSVYHVYFLLILLFDFIR